MVNALEKSGFLEQPLHGTSSKLVKIFREEKPVKPRVLGGGEQGVEKNGNVSSTAI